MCETPELSASVSESEISEPEAKLTSGSEKEKLGEGRPLPRGVCDELRGGGAEGQQGYLAFYDRKGERTSIAS